MSKNGSNSPPATSPDPDKIKRVKKELRRLSQLFRNIDPNKRNFVQKHIEQLAWYNVSAADLQAKIDQWGTLVQYDNGGGQNGIRTNPDVKTLMDYQKNINAITRTLIPLVPAGNRKTHRDLDTFMIYGGSLKHG